MLTVPREPLARFRLLALWFALLVALSNAVGIPIVDGISRQSVTAAVAAFGLAAWWAWAYRRERFPAAGWILETALVVAVAIGSPMPFQGLGLFYGGIQLRALYATRREMPVVIAAYAVARVVSVLIAPGSNYDEALLGSLIVQVLSLSVIAATMHVFVSAVRKQSLVEKALQRSDERYRLLASAARDVFYDLNLTSQQVEWGESMLSVFGYYPAEVGRDVAWWIERIHPDDRVGFEESVSAFLADPTRRLDTYRYRLVRGDGTWANVSGTALLRRDESGKPTNIIGAIRDVTVEVQLAEQLRQSQKMEAVGQLAGGVAHDFNNLLTVIGGHVYMLEHKLPPNEAVERHLKGISLTAERAAGLTKQLLAFSRRQLMKPSVLNANSVIDEVIQMLRPAISENIHIETSLDPLLSPVLADAGQLTQVLVNLALNARDAMAKGGTLAIETANTTLHDGSADALAPALPAGDYVRIVMRDTGDGMTPATLARAFEPFFTTKPPGTGTGLGLATAYGIIKQSSGDIRADSELGAGSTFTILLPAARRPVEVPKGVGAQIRSVPRPVGEQHVLLVEDDDGVRDFAREVLVDAGYTVHEARNGVDALDVAQHVLPTIDVVVTDIVMPRMGGREMVEHLRRRRPDLRVLYMTGYTDDARMLGELRAARAILLEKPFRADALARAVAGVASVKA